METASPPLTPIRQYMTPLDTSPTSSYREQLRRRTSSFSSNHDRSPTSPRKHRFSNASQMSHEFRSSLGAPGDGEGLGNLADELDQLDDEDEYEEGDTTGMLDEPQRDESDKEPRDSGVDVSYSTSRTTSHVKNFSKPFVHTQKPPDEQDEDNAEDRLPSDLEDAINSIARMTSYTSATEDPLIQRTVALLQDLGNQASLEAGAHRLTTSNNSMTANLTAQSKSFQTLATTLYTPFAFSSPLNPEIIEEVTPLVDQLIKELPLPDPAPLQGLQKLDRETTSLTQTLLQLTDTIQIGKQITTTAARHLRITQTMVSDLRMEQDRADLARHELAKSGVEASLRARTCATACKDIMGGFEDVCDALRESLIGDVAA